MLPATFCAGMTLPGDHEAPARHRPRRARRRHGVRRQHPRLDRRASSSPDSCSCRCSGSRCCSSRAPCSTWCSASASSAAPPAPRAPRSDAAHRRGAGVVVVTVAHASRSTTSTAPSSRAASSATAALPEPGSARSCSTTATVAPRPCRVGRSTRDKQPLHRDQRQARRVARHRVVPHDRHGAAPLPGRRHAPPRCCCRSSSLAHAPHARNAAVIGEGSGMTSHLLLGSPSIAELDDDRDRAGDDRRLARFFTADNRRVFDDPRSHFAIDDAKSFFAAQRRHLRRHRLRAVEPVGERRLGPLHHRVLRARAAATSRRTACSASGCTSTRSTTASC